MTEQPGAPASHITDTTDSTATDTAHAAELERLLTKARERYEVEFETLTVDDAPLEILQIRNMVGHLDRLIAANAIKDPLRDLPLWAKIWPASFLLGRFLRKLDPAGKSLLEIGAGCGVTGLIAARYGFARVTITDVNDDALLFARINVLRNGLTDRVEVRRCDITAARLADRYDVVAGAEILYLEDLHRPLAKFLARHVAPGGQAMLCTDKRRKAAHFLKLAGRDFDVAEQPVGVKSTGDDGQEERRLFLVHRLTPKRASTAPVPPVTPA
ncbi:class I SAM-dependent methyltransferase [Nitratidesulfovibrio sp. D1]|uniref:class I SAM-dependent methyltransferase n=1 Tax=Nitratidesulfovibrio sp. D1 TaxID=3440151 RepID=UPI003EBD4E36